MNGFNDYYIASSGRGIWRHRKSVSSRNELKKIPYFDDYYIKSIKCIRHLSLILTNDGQIFVLKYEALTSLHIKKIEFDQYVDDIYNCHDWYVLFSNGNLHILMINVENLEYEFKKIQIVAKKISCGPKSIVILTNDGLYICGDYRGRSYSVTEGHKLNFDKYNDIIDIQFSKYRIILLVRGDNGTEIYFDREYDGLINYPDENFYFSNVSHNFNFNLVNPKIYANNASDDIYLISHDYENTTTTVHMISNIENNKNTTYQKIFNGIVDDVVITYFYVYFICANEVYVKDMRFGELQSRLDAEDFLTNLNKKKFSKNPRSCKRNT